MEQTFIMIKPDGVQRGLVSEIISTFEKKGFYLKGLKLISVERPFAEKHYEDLSSKPFFEGLVEYIISGPVVAMVWEGKNVVATGRKIIGATNPSASDPGTLRGSFAVEIGRYVSPTWTNAWLSFFIQLFAWSALCKFILSSSLYLLCQCK